MTVKYQPKRIELVTRPEGVQGLVAAGVKESEVGFQLKYSKQELRKVIAIYPGKEVRYGLDKLYKKVERHLCEEEGLIQVFLPVEHHLFFLFPEKRTPSGYFFSYSPSLDFYHFHYLCNLCFADFFPSASVAEKKEDLKNWQ